MENNLIINILKKYSEYIVDLEKINFRSYDKQEHMTTLNLILNI